MIIGWAAVAVAALVTVRAVVPYGLLIYIFRTTRSSADVAEVARALRSGGMRQILGRAEAELVAKPRRRRGDANK